MVGSTAEVQSELASILGTSRASTEPEVCAGFAVDGLLPKAVAYPTAPEEVAEILRCAAAHDLAVVPCRNGTKLGIGSPPARYDLALSLKDMNQVWYYEPDDLVVSVEPGMKFGDLQHFLARHRLWIPLDPGGGERASVGGILAANAAGPLRLHYGGPRDMVLGMTIVTADGQVVKTGGRVVKNVAGYDLAKLLIGSYGTLGVIVEATFKLYPRVANRTTWVLDLESLTPARDIRRELLRSPLRPLRVALLNGPTRSLLSGIAPSAGAAADAQGRFALWIEAGGSERVIARYEDDLGRLAAKHHASLQRADREAAEQSWERVSDFGPLLAREQRVPVFVKASLPITACEDFLEKAALAVQADGNDVIGLVQMGVGIVELGLASGSDHRMPTSRFPNANAEPRTPSAESRVPSSDTLAGLRRLAAGLGGSLVITRCPAELKSKVDVWGPPGDDVEVMRKLKTAWDPKSTLSPGRFIGGI